VFKIETCVAEVLLYSRNKGIALVELLIVVILISTLATAFWNFYITRDQMVKGEAEYSPVDSIADSILDEIARGMHQARPDSQNTSGVISVKNDGFSDEIGFVCGNTMTSYFVDGGHYLIRERKSEKSMLLSDVNSLKVTALGSQTLLLTLSMKPDDAKSDTPGAVRSYFKVAAVNATPSNMTQRE
jgi:hypothetical protein